MSDGAPAHNIDGDECYLPPVSIKDTANAVIKITRRGTNIIAVALDDAAQTGCYDALKIIYPSIVACTDLKRLTGQILGIISKNLS